MKREEREYFYARLLEMFNNWAAALEKSGAVLPARMSTFADRYMQTITGQQPVPQALFREFLEELVEEFQSYYESPSNMVNQLRADVDAALLLKQDITDLSLPTTNKTVVGAISEVINTIDDVAGKLSSKYNMYKGGDVSFTNSPYNYGNPYMLVKNLPAGTYTISGDVYTTLTGGQDEQYMDACFIEDSIVAPLESYIGRTDFAESKIHRINETFTTSNSTTLIMYACSKDFFRHVLSIPAGGFIEDSNHPQTDSTLDVKNISIVDENGDDNVIEHLKTDVSDLYSKVLALQAEVESLKNQ